MLEGEVNQIRSAGEVVVDSISHICRIGSILCLVTPHKVNIGFVLGERVVHEVVNVVNRGSCAGIINCNSGAEAGDAVGIVCCGSCGICIRSIGEEAHLLSICSLAVGRVRPVLDRSIGPSGADVGNLLVVHKVVVCTFVVGKIFECIGFGVGCEHTEAESLECIKIHIVGGTGLGERTAIVGTEVNGVLIGHVDKCFVLCASSENEGCYSSENDRFFHNALN